MNSFVRRPFSRRELLRRLAWFGMGTAIASPPVVGGGTASAWATTGDGDTSTRVSKFVGTGGHATSEDAIAAAIAEAAGQPHRVIDFEGVSYVTAGTVTVVENGVTLMNGGIRPTGAFPALSVQADDVTVRNMVFSRSTDSDILAKTPDRCCVVVGGKRFRSLNCNYLGANASCLYLANGRCDGAVITGGEMTTGSMRQNGSGIYAANGPTGNRNLTVDGVYIHDSTMGVSLIDASDCLVVDCRVERMRALPTIVLSGWINVSGQIWRTRAATVRHTVHDLAPDREDGSTGVITVNGIQLGGVYEGSDPGPNAASRLDGHVYINLGGDDPNEKTITSGIVSGYGFMIYTKEVPCERNRFVGNYAEDCDGFGIYLQLGLDGSGGNDNQAVGNTLVNTCRAGRQFVSLPFAAIGVTGGNGTLLGDNTIDSVGTSLDGAPGIHVTSGTQYPRANGSIVGTTVRNGTRHGFYVNSSDWSLNDCHAHRNAGTGFLVSTVAKNAVIERVVLTGCKASNNGQEGFAIDGSNSAIKYVSTLIRGGESIGNALSGVVFVGSDVNSVRDSAVIGIEARDNDVASSGRPEVWVRAGCLRTTVENCRIGSAAPGSVGLVVDEAAVDTVVIPS